MRSASDVQAVILDLFGTLVSAPTDTDRIKAVCALAACMDVAPSTVDAAMSNSWRSRHDGHLDSGDAVAAYLVEMCSADPSTVPAVSACLSGLATPRLRADESVLDTIRLLRAGDARIGVLTDATPDIAEAWDRSALAHLVDVAMFSCRLRQVKPDPELYAITLERLGVSAARAVYCGDGGGAELAGARSVGMRAVRVRRRGGPGTLAFGEIAWSGLTIASIEHLPALLSSGHLP